MDVFNNTDDQIGKRNDSQFSQNENQVFRNFEMNSMGIPGEPIYQGNPANFNYGPDQINDQVQQPQDAPIKQESTFQSKI